MTTNNNIIYLLRCLQFEMCLTVIKSMEWSVFFLLDFKFLKLKSWKKEFLISSTAHDN